MTKPTGIPGNFERNPFVVFYELTQACDLACAHCRASAISARHPHELSPAQSRALVDDLLGFDTPPILVLTGGDPMKRDDVIDLTAYAKSRGVHVALTPSATPLVTDDAIRQLKEAGLERLAVSVDGADAETHDAFRRVEGSYERTQEILAAARAHGLPRQVNTTITARNLHQIDDMAEQMAAHGVLLWSVFFLVPVGRGVQEARITPGEYEKVFRRLWHHAGRQPYGIKTTEAPHYRRFVLQRLGDPQGDPTGHRGDRLQRAPLGVNDGNGVMFISHTGKIYPSGFMPLQCGRFPAQSVVDVYRDSPLMRELRQPDLLHGKCGDCEFRQICGGSRARSYAVTGDPLGSEPDCIYVPESHRREQVAAVHEPSVS